jgi:hypothetical protein
MRGGAMSNEERKNNTITRKGKGQKGNIRRRKG